MKAKFLIILFCFVFFLSGCACVGSYCRGYYYNPCHYYCGDYCTDCYNKSFYYSSCDNNWHNTLCSGKPYLYVKTKYNDFPIDYRTKYEECCLPLAYPTDCIPGRC